MAISASLVARLRDPALVREAGLIAGKWLDESASGASFDVINPSDGSILASVPYMGLAEIRSAIDAAYLAQKAWASVTAKQRSLVLRRYYDLLVANLDDLATILVAEMGKPFNEAKGEILYGASYAEWYSEEAKRLYGDIIPGHQQDKRLFVIRQPVGVVGGVTAWNFPSAMPMRKIAPALAAGCAMVFKPADLTPLSAIALGVLAEQAGVPAGLLSIVTIRDAAAFGAEICQNAKVRKLTFTGSTQVGRLLMRQASDQIMKLSLELGGNAPFIVFDDADVEAAVEGAIQSKFRNAGQTCVCANRLYVQSGIYDAFASKLTERVSALKVGDGFEPGVDIGPMIDRRAVAKVMAHVEDATRHGGRVTTGGRTLERGPLFLAPTVVADANAQMLFAREETFGPLAPLFRFDTVEDVIRMANDTEFGLASYFYTRDISRAWRVAEALEYGMVGMNTGLISTELAPFGGVKQSGVGREGSRYGLEDFTEMKYMCLGAI